MTPKEKKAFVKKMREAKEAKAKERKGSKPKYAKNIEELKKGKKLNPKSQKKVNKALADIYRRSKGKFGRKKK